MVESLEMSSEYSPCFFQKNGGGVFWTDLKNSVGEVEAQILHGAGVDRNVQRMLLLLFFKNMGGVFLTDLRNSVGGVEAQNLRGGGVAHN